MEELCIWPTDFLLMPLRATLLMPTMTFLNHLPMLTVERWHHFLFKHSSNAKYWPRYSLLPVGDSIDAYVQISCDWYQQVLHPFNGSLLSNYLLNCFPFVLTALLFMLLCAYRNELGSFP